MANYPAVLYGGQGGMLGVYVSPNFATDQSVYLTYSEPGDQRLEPGAGQGQAGAQ